MKALTSGRYAGREGAAALFDLGPEADGAQLLVRILEDDIGRVTLRPAGGYRLDRGWSVAPGGAAAGMEPDFPGRARDDLSGFRCPSMTVEAGADRVRLAAGGLVAEVRLAPLAIAWYRAGETVPFLADRPTQAYFRSRRTPAFQHFQARQPGQRHFGLGDKAGPLDRTGRRFRIDAVDPCGFDAETSDPLYKMIPFLLVDGAENGAHGLFYDNLAVGEVDLGCTLDNYHGLFRGYRAEDGDLDYYVLAGPAARDVVRRFSWLTGGQAFAPRWSFGFACTSMTITDAPDADARIQDFIDRCRQHDIACDSFHFGSGYSSIGPRRYVFHWNRDKFPDPPATMARLRAAGMMPVTNIKPCLLDDHPRLDEARDGQVLVRNGADGAPALAQFWDGMGCHVDFTHPPARAWWRAGMEGALLDQGVAAMWNDNNEYEIWDEDAVCRGDGRPFALALARPAQALLMTKLAHDVQAARAPDRRPYTISRAGPAGLARYGQTWSGDNATAWKTLRFNLVQGLQMSLSGLFNIGHDVGGFHGPSPGPELFCRFVEFCALWPRFVINSWKADKVVSLPWMHPSVLDEVRQAMRLRYRLMPYLYTQMWRASAEGEPPLRPLFLDFPGDAGAAAVEDAFMLGPDLLVAPVLEAGATERTVRLPDHPGGWHDWHDGRLYHGGRPATVAAPLGRLPLFARAGAMIPVGRQYGGLLRTPDDRRELIVCGQATGGSDALLYEDDGETTGWRDGGALILRLTQTMRGPVGIVDAETLSDGHRPAFATIGVRALPGSGATLQLGAQPVGAVRLELVTA